MYSNYGYSLFRVSCVTQIIMTSTHLSGDSTLCEGVQKGYRNSLEVKGNRLDKMTKIFQSLE